MEITGWDINICLQRGTSINLTNKSQPYGTRVVTITDIEQEALCASLDDTESNSPKVVVPGKMIQRKSPSQIHQSNEVWENPMDAQGKSQISQATDDRLHGQKSSIQSASTHISRQRNLIDRNDHSDGFHPPSQVHQCFAAGKTHVVTQGESQTSQVTDDGLHSGKSSLLSAPTHNSRQKNSMVRNDHSDGLHLPSQVLQCIAAPENYVVAQGETQTPQVTDDGLHGEKSSLLSASTHISRQRNLMDRNDHSDGLHPPSQVHQCFAAGKTHVVAQGDSQTSQVTDDGLHGGKSSFQSASTHNSRQRNSMVRNHHSDGLHPPSQVHQCIAARETHVVAQGESQTLRLQVMDFKVKNHHFKVSPHTTSDRGTQWKRMITVMLSIVLHKYISVLQQGRLMCLYLRLQMVGSTLKSHFFKVPLHT